MDKGTHMKFYDIKLSISVNVQGLFGGTYRLNLHCRRINKKETDINTQKSELVSYLTFISTLKMEAIFSSETSVDFHLNTRRYIPENTTPHSHRS
jgi:hypothetical protein